MKTSAVALALFLVPFAATPAHTQDTKGSILGQIFDEANGAPLAKARVSIDGTKLRAQTDSIGAFRIDNVPEGEVMLRIERNGYSTLVENVLVHAGWTSGVELQLTPIAIMLDALRVRTGANMQSGAKRDEIRPDVNGIARSPTDALAARAPGVLIMRPSGEVGRGTKIMIRGPSSISLPNLPVVYLDGVRVNAQMVGFRNEGYVSLDFISSESIDRIEILRGPSAAAQYGGEASGGVILIYTKR